MSLAGSRQGAVGPEAAQLPERLDQENIDLRNTEKLKAWELIDAEAGRYMPRRIRGSFRGRALG